MDQTNETVQRSVRSAALFVADTLGEGHLDADARWVNSADVAPEVTALIGALARFYGGTVSDGDAPQPATPEQLNALLSGTRFHIQISKAGWELVLNALPVGLSISRALIGDPIAVAEAALTLGLMARALAETVHALTEAERDLYLVVAALDGTPAHATIDAIVRTVSSSNVRLDKDPQAITIQLQQLVLKGVLRKSGDTYGRG